MHPSLISIPVFELLGRRVGPITFHTYGTLLCLAVLSSLFVVAKLARRAGLDPERTTDLAILSVIGGLIGSRLMLAAIEWQYFRSHPSELFSLLLSGGVFYGGFIGAIPVAFWYVWKHKLPGWQTSDILVPALVLGQAIGRIGCLMAGCCYGMPTSLPWAVVFTSIEARRRVGTPLDVALHPVQVYESLACLVIFGVLLWLGPRKRFHGQVTLAYVLLYSVARFTLEFFRGDEIRGFIRLSTYRMVSTSQAISVVLFLATILVLPYLIKKQRIQRHSPA